MTAYRLKGASGAVINQSWTLGPRTLIGSGPDCDIRIENNGIAQQHAELIVTESEIVLSRLEPGAALFVNGKSVTDTWLSSGDEVRIADCRWVLQAPGLKPKKILTREAIRRRRSLIPWLLVGGLIAAGTLAWWLGYLPF